MADDYQDLMMLWCERMDALAEEPPQAKDTNAPTPLLAEDRLAFAAYEGQVQGLYQAAQAALIKDLLGRIHVMPFKFFERLVVEILLAMGYGARLRDLARVVGKTGDGGIDGIISLDALGLDQVYLQAKRLKPGSQVPVSDVRDFAGSLDAVHASKGVFLSTGTFSMPARAFVQSLSRRIVLVDGQHLATLMIRYNLGVRVKETYQVKTVDPGYFVMPTRN
jgi:restriction system protein